MEKKIYKQPIARVIEINPSAILAGSDSDPVSAQTEEYEEVNESVTDDWYN